MHWGKKKEETKKNKNETLENLLQKPELGTLVSKCHVVSNSGRNTLNRLTDDF